MPENETADRTSGNGQHLVPAEPLTGDTAMTINRDPGPITKGPDDKFAGDVWLWPQIGATRNTEVRNVLFTPGAHSAWHRHPAGQVLHVTAGVGFVQSRGGERQLIRAGDTIICHPGQEHWHGATPDAFMTHIAVTDGPTEWQEHVTDEEYQG
ncbi:cupin domain-containing protein [Nocardia sp. NPDC088792]|uniref:(R)-mandelonitrile lyase n=1 Tax=Nocardia sp. NPDC088792 TaxID=3364332 RepID=UPI00381AE04B